MNSLSDNGLAVLENEKIERHIMKAIPGGHNLFVADVEVAKRIENLYNKFKVNSANIQNQIKIKIQNRNIQNLKSKNKNRMSVCENSIRIISSDEKVKFRTTKSHNFAVKIGHQPVCAIEKRNNEFTNSRT